MVFVITLLFMANPVAADIISINNGGTQDLVITPSKYIEGFFFPFENLTIEDVGTITVPPSSGGPSQTGQDGPYQLYVYAQEDRYEAESEVDVDIKITNSGDQTEKKVTFTIYLLSPSQIIYDTTQEQLATVGPGETTFTRTLRLPIDSELGEWRVYAVYGPEEEPTMTAFDSFEVVKSLAKENLLKVVLLVSIIFFVLYIAGKKRQKRNYYGSSDIGEDEVDE